MTWLQKLHCKLVATSGFGKNWAELDQNDLKEILCDIKIEGDLNKTWKKRC